MNTESWAAFVGVACIILMVQEGVGAVSISMVNGSVRITGPDAHKYRVVTNGNRSDVLDRQGRIVSSYMSSGNSRDGYRSSTFTQHSFGNGGNGGFVSTSSSSSSGRRASNMARAIHSRTQNMIQSMFQDMGMGGLLGGGGSMAMAMAGA